MMADGVFVVWMRQGSHECPFVAAGRQHRQMLADLDTRPLRRNWRELAPDRVGSLRFGVKTVVLRESAGKKNVDHGLPTLWSLATVSRS